MCSRGQQCKEKPPEAGLPILPGVGSILDCVGKRVVVMFLAPGVRIAMSTDTKPSCCFDVGLVFSGNSISFLEFHSQVHVEAGKMNLEFKIDEVKILITIIILIIALRSPGSIRKTEPYSTQESSLRGARKSRSQRGGSLEPPAPLVPEGQRQGGGDAVPTSHWAGQIWTWREANTVGEVSRDEQEGGDGGKALLMSFQKLPLAGPG